MNQSFLDYLYIAATIVFGVCGQLILKWRIRDFGTLPTDSFEKLRFLVFLVFDPVMFIGFFATLLSSLAWMAALTKFDLSYAFTFTSLTFVFVLLLSAWLLSEPLSLRKVLGVAMIVIGTVVAARG